MKQKLVIAALVLAVLAAPVLAQTTFTDVSDDPDREAILYAARKGWFEGYEDGTFRPDQKISSNQLGAVVSRAFPDGETRGRVAAFMKAGEAGLATPDQADPEPSKQTNEGRFLALPEFPIVRIFNMPYREHLERCHITHDVGYRQTLAELKRVCEAWAETWQADIVFTPPGSDINWSSLFVHFESDEPVGNAKLKFGPRNRIDDVENLRPRMVRDQLARVKLDVMIDCTKYAAWSEDTVLNISDIPRESCLPEEDGQ